MVVAEVEMGVRSEPKIKRCYLMTNEVGMCMKTNKKTITLPRKKGDISTHFSQNHRFFAETARFFVTIGAFENEFRTSKCRNSKPRVQPVESGADGGSTSGGSNTVPLPVRRVHPRLLILFPCGELGGL
jgi:hypothetical protein